MGAAQQYNKTGYTSAVFSRLGTSQQNNKKVCLSGFIKWGTAEQCKKTGNTTAMFQDWEHLGNVLRQGIRRQCYKIRNSSAM